MRLIDADTLPHYDGTALSAVEVAIAVDDAPTIDAVLVVRCKDCKYSTEHYDTDGNVSWWGCSEWDSGTDADGFCYLEGRKDDEDN